MASALSDEQLLERLVAFDTTSHRSNLPLLDFVADYLDRPEARIHRQAAPHGAKANLVVELGPPTDPDRRDGLVLSGHMDVVPAEEPEWTSDPFQLTERQGRLYARGAADMKGFLAVAVNVAATVDPTRLRAPLVLLFTYDEELGTLGARHFHDAWPAEHLLPRAALIGEPTELQVVRLHKGHLKLRVTVHGTSAHSAYPHLGDNAVEPAGRLVGDLARLRGELEDERVPSSIHFSEVPFPSLNVACIRGGSAINVVPDRCEVDLGLRLLPGMEVEAAVERVQSVVARSLGDRRHALEVLSVSPPVSLAADAPFFRRLCELAGEPAEPGVSFATDAGWLQQRGMECVLYGPGSIRVAHKPNEFLPRDELQRARQVVERLVEDLAEEATD